MPNFALTLTSQETLSRSFWLYGAAGFRLCLPEESVWFAPLAEPHAERLPPTLCGLSPPRQHVRLEHPRL